MVNCNNDAYYFGRFGSLDHDVSETGSVFFIGIGTECSYSFAFVRSDSCRALDNWRIALIHLCQFLF